MDTHISVKGQIVIPAALRRKYGLAPGTAIRFEDSGDGVLIKAVNEQTVRKLEGVLKGKGALKALQEHRARPSGKEGP